MSSVSINPKIFYRYLKELVDIPSCFWNKNDLSKGISYCQNVLKDSSWKTIIDPQGNLISYNNNYQKRQPFLWLSAHIDTVGADPDNWITDPFLSVETEDHILGRGVNDCKAGVALILSFFESLKNQHLESKYNVGVMIMYREEGNQGKTSSLIDFSDLPLSDAGNLYITLENTVRVLEKNRYEIGLYDREPHNLFVQVTSALKDSNTKIQPLIELGFKLIVVNPECDTRNFRLVKTLKNRGAGHSATCSDNELLSIMSNYSRDDYLIKTGDPQQTSIMSPDIFVFSTREPVFHKVILNYRGFESPEKMYEVLHTVDGCTPFFPFKHGLGSTQNKDLPQWVYTLFLDHQSPNVKVKVTPNPGRSDASSIYNAIPIALKKLIHPVACGIGCRSHKDRSGIWHKTHGINEGFYKPSLKYTLPFYQHIINRFKIT